jgi:hypothetical protein
VIIHEASSATGDINWSEVVASTSSDSVRTVSRGPDGLVYVGGRFIGAESANPTEYLESFVLSIDTDGNRADTFVFQSDGSVGSGDITTGIARLANGKTIVSADAYGVFEGETGFGKADGVVLQLSSEGAIDWVTQFGTDVSDNTTGVAVASDGSTYVVAYSEGTNEGGSVNSSSRNAFVHKFDASGVMQWTRSLTSDTPETFAGIALDADENILVCGSAVEQLGEQAFGNSDAIVRAYSPTGDVLWTDQFGTASNDSCDAIAVKDGDIYIAGVVGGSLDGQTHQGGFDVFIKKYRH